jgi:hypothetical protein
MPKTSEEAQRATDADDTAVDNNGIAFTLEANDSAIIMLKCHPSVTLTPPPRLIHMMQLPCKNRECLLYVIRAQSKHTDPDLVSFRQEMKTLLSWYQTWLGRVDQTSALEVMCASKSQRQIVHSLSRQVGLSAVSIGVHNDKSVLVCSNRDTHKELWQEGGMYTTVIVNAATPSVRPPPLNRIPGVKRAGLLGLVKERMYEILRQRYPRGMVCAKLFSEYEAVYREKIPRKVIGCFICVCVCMCTVSMDSCIVCAKLFV